MINFKKPAIDYTELLKLAQQLTDDQYGDDNNYTNYQEVLDDYEYIPPEISKPVDPSAAADLTKMKSDKIKGAISKNSNITVGQFVIKIHRLSGSYEQAKFEKADELDISLYEKGRTNAIHKKVHVYQDPRFKGVPFLSYFKDATKAGKGVPIDTVVEIVRWLQIITKIGIFL